MLASLLQHHLDRALRGVTYNAIAHCHAMGLHSIMLHDAPENRIRMFVTDTGHDLYTNNGSSSHMSLAVHAHHCDVRFVNVFGNAENHRYRMVPDGVSLAPPWHEMDYVSAITTGGPGSLTPTGKRAWGVRTAIERLADNPVMRADEMHTIYVPISERAAWLVIEGREDPDYDSKCWTLNKEPDLGGLYRPLPHIYVVRALQEALQQHQLKPR